MSAPKKRHQFRCDYRKRSIYSFGQGVDALYNAHHTRSDSNEHAGFFVGESYSSFAHSLEMIGKATLEKKSSYLTFEKLNFLDQRDETSGRPCITGIKALFRALKFFRKKLKKNEIDQLVTIIEQRNSWQHRQFKVKNIQKAISDLVNTGRILEEIYNKEFRNANLFQETNDFCDDSTRENFLKAETENTKKFRFLERKIKSLKKNGKKFIVCLNCHYETGILNKDEKSYTCLFCEDQRSKVDCESLTCMQKVWVSNSTKPAKCDWHVHISDLQGITGSGNVSFDSLPEPTVDQIFPSSSWRPNLSIFYDSYLKPSEHIKSFPNKESDKKK